VLGALATGLTNRTALGTTELHVLRASRRLDPRFLYYVTVSDAFRRLGAAEMYGAGGQKRVPESFVENLRHPLPPIEEQRAIAVFLDRETTRIDELVGEKERLIVLLQEGRTALITRAVRKGLDPNVPMKESGVEWLGKIPAPISRLQTGLTFGKEYESCNVIKRRYLRSQTRKTDISLLTTLRKSRCPRRTQGVMS
jgi:type I restriction enzyme S subunit